MSGPEGMHEPQGGMVRIAQVSERKVFYVRAFSEDGRPLATSIQVDMTTLPEGLTYQQTVDVVAAHIIGEVSRYFAHECVRGMGVHP